MICRKCANMFDDSLSSCPECGTPAIMGCEKKEEEEKKPFVLSIPDEELETDSDVASAEPEQKAETETEEEIEAAAESEAEEKEEVYEAPEYEGESEFKEEKPKVKRLKRTVKTRKEPKKESIGDKSAAALIVSLMCILACMMVVLTFVGIKSDVFKKDADAVKTVALSGLSGEETGKLEQWLSKLGAVSAKELDPANITVNEVLELVNPGESNGLYQAFYESEQITANEKDPAHRFYNENGDYSFYKIPQEKIDAVIALLGFNENHTANGENCYYYDGFYYFRNSAVSDPSVSYIADVAGSKRIQDGSYYIEYSLIEKNNPSAEPLERYAVVEKTTDENGELQWVIKNISASPVFDTTGVLIKAEDEVNFVMEKETIEMKADDGTVYRKYIIEYPRFSGNSLGEQAANQLYSDMITAFSLQEASVQSDYKKYIGGGGKKDELPLLTHVVTRVTYTENGFISVIEDTLEYVPVSMPVQGEAASEEAEQETDKAVTLPKRTVEGYNFDVETGEFITKDAIIGKDYIVISKLLYRIYNGYGYDDIIKQLQSAASSENDDDTAEESTEMQEIPDDEDELGIKIYESASALCEEGYLFCFVTKEGYSRDVVIPFEIPNLFVLKPDKE